MTFVQGFKTSTPTSNQVVAPKLLGWISFSEAECWDPKIYFMLEEKRTFSAEQNDQGQKLSGSSWLIAKARNYKQNYKTQCFMWPLSA